jgi:hypothetical protein
MPAGDHLSQARSVPPKHKGLDNEPSFIEGDCGSQVRRDRLHRRLRVYLMGI